jgi:hypothetical protein
LVEEVLEQSNKAKLIHQCFRIEEGVIKALEKESRKKGVPLSHVINKILKNYVTSERYFLELGFLLSSKDLIRKLLGRIEEKYLIEDAKEFGLTIAKEYIPYFFMDVNTYTLLEFLEIWLGRFPFQHRIDFKRHSYSINHDLGTNYSIFFREYMTALIESIIKSPVKFNIVAPNTVTFSFEIV